MTLEFLSTPSGWRATNADRMGLTTDEKTAKYLGISPQLYSYRMRHLSAWSYEDLCNIFKKLRFSQSDIETLFKN